jgi:hypothetical protein
MQRGRAKPPTHRRASRCNRHRRRVWLLRPPSCRRPVLHCPAFENHHQRRVVAAEPDAGAVLVGDCQHCRPTPRKASSSGRLYAGEVAVPINAALLANVPRDARAKELVVARQRRRRGRGRRALTAHPHSAGKDQQSRRAPRPVAGQARRAPASEPLLGRSRLMSSQASASPRPDSRAASPLPMRADNRRSVSMPSRSRPGCRSRCSLDDRQKSDSSRGVRCGPGTRLHVVRGERGAHAEPRARTGVAMATAAPGVAWHTSSKHRYRSVESDTLTRAPPRDVVESMSEPAGARSDDTQD